MTVIAAKTAKAAAAAAANSNKQQQKQQQYLATVWQYSSMKNHCSSYSFVDITERQQGQCPANLSYRYTENLVKKSQVRSKNLCLFGTLLKWHSSTSSLDRFYCIHYFLIDWLCLCDFDWSFILYSTFIERLGYFRY